MGAAMDCGKSVTAKDCYWIRDRKPDGDPIWHTTCGHIHEFMDGGPKENEHRFCPYCGGRIDTVDRIAGAKP